MESDLPNLEKEYMESQVTELQTRLDGFKKLNDAAGIAKQEHQEEIIALKREIKESVDDVRVVNAEMKKELIRWSQVHKTNRVNVVEFKKKVAEKVLALRGEIGMAKERYERLIGALGREVGEEEVSRILEMAGGEE